MNVFVNDKPIILADSATLKDAILQTGIPLNGIAVAVNNAIVSKNLWNEKTLSENDRILIIRATQGG